MDSWIAIILGFFLACLPVNLLCHADFQHQQESIVSLIATVFQMGHYGFVRDCSDVHH